MATAFDTFRAKTPVGDTFSNNDTLWTAPAASGDGSERSLPLTTGLTLSTILGNNLYYEFEITDPEAKIVSLKSSLITDEHLTADFVSTARIGKQVSDLFDTGTFSDDTYLEYITLTGQSGWWRVAGSGTTQVTACSGGAQYPQPGNGDRVGVLIRGGTVPHKPFHMQVDIYVNGVAYHGSRVYVPGGGDFKNRVYTPAIWVQMSTVGWTQDVQMELIQSASWTSAPTVYPSPVEWNASPASPNIEDNGYCRLITAGTEYNDAENRHEHPKLGASDMSMSIGRNSATSASSTSVCFGSTPRFEGKWYFEGEVTEISPSSPPASTIGEAIGIGTGAGEVSRNASGSRGAAMYITGNTISGGAEDEVYVNGQRLGPAFPTPLIGGDLPERRARVGDVFQIACDIPGGDDPSGDRVEFWIGLDNTWYPGNPATTPGYSNTSNELNTTVGAQGPWFPMFVISNGQNYVRDKFTWTPNFGATPFTYTPPTGFSAWDSTALPT